MARAKSTTDESVQTVLRAIRNGLTLRKGCLLAGITPQSFLRRVEESEELRKEYDAARAEPEQRMLSVIWGAAPENWTAAAWYLERCHPKRYSRAAGERAVRRMDMSDNEYDPAQDGDLPEG